MRKIANYINNQTYRALLFCLFLSILSYEISGQPMVGPQILSPQVNTDKTVTFRFLAPTAKDVRLNVQFEKDFDLTAAIAILQNTPGVILLDDPSAFSYPMPLFAEGKDDVFVGRVRRDESVANGLNLWVVADNLRKVAATNAVKIAELVSKL